MTQDAALLILKTGANVFLTGEPGSGKSHTVNAYVAYLEEHGIEASVTASTGIAATHIDGMTVHSWCGMGIKETVTDYDLDLISQKEKVVKRVRGAHVLIIDEISMLSSTTLSSVEAVCRSLRASSRPFGGLQVVFVGDFFQLPPIVKNNQQGGNGEFEYDEPKSPFAFNASAWERANPIVCYLSEQHRQEDAAYLRALTAVRRGEVDEEVHLLLSTRKVTPAPDLTLTKLFPHNANVDLINEQALANLPGLPRAYAMQSRGAPPLIEALKRNCLSPEKLMLKVGARVIFTKNSMEGDYYNGTMGEVVGYDKMSGYPHVKLKSGRVLEVEPEEWAVMDGNKKLAEITQLPLRLAWAITVHKSQGMSLDAALIDLRAAFEYGQGYVALSRVRTLGGLYLLGFNARALEVHPEVLQRDEQFREASDAAEDSFLNLPENELSQMHQNFIRACGGTVRNIAQEKPKVADSDKKYSVETLRHKYPNAYRPWSKEEDAKLLARHAEGAKVKALAEEFGRQSGSIRSRLEKLTA